MDGSAGEASADVHRLARVCADEIAGKRFRKGLIDADSVEDAAAMIQAQIYREWGVAIVKGRAECLLALLECTVPNASPRSKVACGKSRDKFIERATLHMFGGLPRRFCLEEVRCYERSGPRPPPMNRRRAVSPPGAPGLRPLVLAP